jgi:ParB family chromosome partitioning protein
MPLEQLRANPNQPRKQFDPEALNELTQSIERHGLLQPITIKRDPKNKNGFLIVAGERRFRAYERLGRITIPAIITSGKADEIALIENLQREDLNPIEEAEALQRLQKKYNYTHEELGKTVGKARSTITNLLKLNDLPRQIKADCSNGYAVSKSLLIELSKLDSPKKQLAFWKETKQRGVTVKEARARKRAVPNYPEATQKALARGDQFIQELEQIASANQKLDRDAYDKLLGVFKRFVRFMDEEANRQTGKANRGKR